MALLDIVLPNIPSWIPVNIFAFIIIGIFSWFGISDWQKEFKTPSIIAFIGAIFIFIIIVSVDLVFFNIVSVRIGE